YRQCQTGDLDSIRDKRPVAADLDGIAVGGAAHGLGQRVVFADFDALVAQEDEGARFRLGCFRPDLSGVLEPLPVVRSLPPALVGRAGADTVHVRTQVIAVRPDAVAGAPRR